MSSSTNTENDLTVNLYRVMKIMCELSSPSLNGEGLYVSQLQQISLDEMKTLTLMNIINNFNNDTGVNQGNLHIYVANALYPQSIANDTQVLHIIERAFKGMLAEHYSKLSLKKQREILEANGNVSSIESVANIDRQPGAGNRNRESSRSGSDFIGLCNPKRRK